MKKVLIILLLCLTLSGCWVLEIPTRDQWQERDTAQNALVGNYVVVDSRLDFLQIESVTVLPQRGFPVFILYQKDGNYLMLGLRTGCRGMHQDNPKYVSLQCKGRFARRELSGVHIKGFGHVDGPNYLIDFSKKNTSYLIENFKNLPQYHPMEARPDDYIMSLSVGSFNPKWHTPETSMIRSTTDGPAQYALKRRTPDKSDVEDTSATQKAQTAQNTAKAPKPQSTNDNATSALDKVRAAAGATTGGSTGTGE